MKKLTLNVDELRVESFSTSPELQQRHGGTVRAYDHTAGDCLPGLYPVDPAYTVHGCTFDATCGGDTCPGSTEWGAHTCNDLSCAGMCASDNCVTFDCP